MTSHDAIDRGVGPLLPGTKWVIRGKLGEGGMGIVFDVVKAGFLEGAMKVLHPRYANVPELAARFLDEVKLTATLEHPNIVRVLDFDRLTDGTPFMVMERLRGRTLRAALRQTSERGRRWTPNNGYAVAAHVCQGLARAHAHAPSIVHRDIKPENIFLHRLEGNVDPVIKVMDFGIAAIAGGADKSRIGTPRYMAPEQLRGDPLTPHTDQYALGLVIYEMLTGRLPWDIDLRDLAALTDAHWRIPPQPPSAFCAGLPAEVDAAILKALSKDPHKRHASVHGLLYELRALHQTNGSPTGGASTQSTEPTVGTIADGYPPVREELDPIGHASHAPWQNLAEDAAPQHMDPPTRGELHAGKRGKRSGSVTESSPTAARDSWPAESDAAPMLLQDHSVVTPPPSSAAPPDTVASRSPLRQGKIGVGSPRRRSMTVLLAAGLMATLAAVDAYVHRSTPPRAPALATIAEIPSFAPPASPTPTPSVTPDPPPQYPRPDKGVLPGRLNGPCPGCRTSLPGGVDPRPLLVLLHGDGETASSMFDAWAPAAERRAIAVLAVTCPLSEGCTQQSWWQWNGDPAYLREQIRFVTDRQAIDPGRLWIAGWSGGASYIGYRTQEIERTFSAIVIHGGGIRPADSSCSTPQASVYFLVGNANPLHNLAVQLRDYYAGCGNDLSWNLLQGAAHDGERRALGSRIGTILDWLATKRRTVSDASVEAHGN